MNSATILSLINVYAVWLYAVGVIALLYALFELRAASKNLSETIFSLEKEFAAARERRARTGLLFVLTALALLTVIRFGIAPAQPVAVQPEPTRTRLVIELPTPEPITPTPTLTRIPTRPRPTPLAPTETPTATPLPPPPCPLLNTCISSPMANEVVSGEVTVRGTATTEAFQFYKVEYGWGETPERWNSIGDIQTSPVVDGTLTLWNTVGLEDGVYALRLTVVDVSGNFGPPYEVPVVVQN